MATEVVIPMLGVTVENGKVVEWLKKEGDPVSKGESIFVVEADKVTTEVESPASGILARILLPPGEEVPVLSVVGVITSEGESIPESYGNETANASQPPASSSHEEQEMQSEQQSAVEDYDLAVIGGGPGGYVAAICGAREGLKTVLIEKNEMGGTCLNRGCIPTKSLVSDTKLYRAVKDSPVITAGEGVQLDFDKMFERKRKVVKTLVSGVAGLVKSNGAEVIKGEAHLNGPGKITVHANGDAPVSLSAKNIILANGSKPAVPSFITIDGKLVQTTDEILDDSTFPNKILVIGGGVIGIELATVYSNAGAEVIVVEALEDIILTEDKDVRKMMARQLTKKGVKLHRKTTVKDVVADGSSVSVRFQSGDSEEQTVTVDKVLVATGRAPVLSGIDVDKLGLETNGRFIKVGPTFMTNLPGVYAIGDLIGGMMLAHKASAEAEIAVENILGASKSLDSALIPRCIWGALEVGAVGLNEEEAVNSGRDIKTGVFRFGASGAAQAKGNVNGLAKIIGDAKTGEILGVHIIGDHATDMIAEAVSVMKMEGAVEDLYEAIKPHPTLSETVFEAAMDWNNKAIHLPKK